ncbi:F5/8 type C domain-containing protein [Parapedobacter composti]|uniref:F5/8 type C domain-containing protein n=1 Tax=Parapedobacter composti TaxID=623281 RepID=A0A1I1H8B3_9SPHI|nr:DUF1735 domain-containing protein [Parapedobacter composti]SFC20061.1 F5/8 type C domain-containing protein [Parapedobacter composti]
MKSVTYKFLLLICFTVALVSLGGCLKDEIPLSEHEGYIYMPQAVGNRAQMRLARVDEAQDIVFGAAYGGVNYPEADIRVAFKLDISRIAEYNAEHETNYIPLPENSYQVSGLAATIPAGKSNSEPLAVSVQSNMLDVNEKYMLPITMVSVSGGILDNELATAWFRIDSIVTRERDVTGLSSVSVSDENRGGPNAAEGSEKLIDNDYNTKFLTFDYSPQFWMQLMFTTPEVVNAYTLTSGNDAPGRDPRSWVLSGSNDGTDWVELDVQTNELFSGRNQTRRFNINNDEAYRYYRINVTANGGDALFQLSEWRLIQYY